MDVAHHGDWSRNVDHIAFFHQQLFRLGTYCLDDRVCQQFFPVESLNALVQIDTSCLHNENRRMQTGQGSQRTR